MASKTKGGRLPGSFEFHWGGGQTVEEASYVGTTPRASLAMAASRIAGLPMIRPHRPVERKGVEIVADGVRQSPPS